MLRVLKAPSDRFSNSHTEPLILLCSETGVSTRPSSATRRIPWALDRQNSLAHAPSENAENKTTGATRQNVAALVILLAIPSMALTFLLARLRHLRPAPIPPDAFRRITKKLRGAAVFCRVPLERLVIC